jgi:hypothetical protein
MVYLVLLAPVGAMALLVGMSVVERWQETDMRHLPPERRPTARARHGIPT